MGGRGYSKPVSATSLVTYDLRRSLSLSEPVGIKRTPAALPVERLMFANPLHPQKNPEASRPQGWCVSSSIVPTLKPPLANNNLDTANAAKLNQVGEHRRYRHRTNFRDATIVCTRITGKLEPVKLTPIFAMAQLASKPASSFRSTRKIERPVGQGRCKLCRIFKCFLLIATAQHAANSFDRPAPAIHKIQVPFQRFRFEAIRGSPPHFS